MAEPGDTKPSTAPKPALEPPASVKAQAKPEPEWPDEVLSIPLCPPSDSIQAGGKLYRYINAPEDWQTYPQQKKLNENSTQHQKCRGCALSCYLSLPQLRQALQMKGYLFASAVVVEADLTAAHGKMLVTNQKTQHVSLWLKRSLAGAPQQVFKPVQS